jgi:hypothetical protein
MAINTQCSGKTRWSPLFTLRLGDMSREWSDVQNVSITMMQPREWDVGRLGQHGASASSSSHLEGRLHSGDLEQAEFGQSSRLLLLFPNGGVAGRYHGVGVAMGGLCALECVSGTSKQAVQSSKRV